jgi:ubiquinone biosynthesis protein UbiJ
MTFLSGELKSIISSPHDSRSIVKIVEAISTLKERLQKLENRVERLEKRSWSRSVALSNRD